MRPLLPALALAFALATTGASAQTADVFLGRPPSPGVVRGGGFGIDGFDYYGDGRRGGPPGRDRRAPAATVTGHPRVAHAPARPGPSAARPDRP